MGGSTLVVFADIAKASLKLYELPGANTDQHSKYIVTDSSKM